MNFVGHHEVAARAGLDAAGRLGAMLPDFASMLGVRLQRDALPPAVATGVDLHHATDAMFHDHAPVRSGMHALGAALRATEVGRGASRAIGHIGYEMLLDSTLDAPDLRAALAAGEDGPITAAMGGHEGWATMRARLAGGGARYDDVAWVADRLHDALARRPRLAFPAAQRPAVAAALAVAMPRVQADAAAIFAAVTAAVSAPVVVSAAQSGSRSV